MKRSFKCALFDLGDLYRNGPSTHPVSYRDMLDAWPHKLFEQYILKCGEFGIKKKTWVQAVHAQMWLALLRPPVSVCARSNSVKTTFHRTAHFLFVQYIVSVHCCRVGTWTWQASLQSTCPISSTSPPGQRYHVRCLAPRGPLHAVHAHSARQAARAAAAVTVALHPTQAAPPLHPTCPYV